MSRVLSKLAPLGIETVKWNTVTLDRGYFFFCFWTEKVKCSWCEQMKKNYVLMILSWLFQAASSSKLRNQNKENKFPPGNQEEASYHISSSSCFSDICMPFVRFLRPDAFTAQLLNRTLNCFTLDAPLGALVYTKAVLAYLFNSDPQIDRKANAHHSIGDNLCCHLLKYAYIYINIPVTDISANSCFYTSKSLSSYFWSTCQFIRFRKWNKYIQIYVIDVSFHGYRIDFVLLTSHHAYKQNW